MCLRTIIDASERGQGVVVYSPSHTKYADELDGDAGVRALLLDYNQRGLAHDIDASPVQAALIQIPDRPVRRSNDAHVLALAVASGAAVLFSCDSDLREDPFAPPVPVRIFLLGLAMIDCWRRNMRQTVTLYD